MTTATEISDYTISKDRNMRIICISDTHGKHRTLNMPPGDILIHAGDYTCFGNEQDASDFNKWLGELPYKHKLVVEGNHEYHAKWKDRISELLNNATLLNQSSVVIEGLKVFGTCFNWNAPERNPNYDQIDGDTDILVGHAPPRGYVDAGLGCRAFIQRIKEVMPKVVICGHIHEASGIQPGTDDLIGVTFVNAAVMDKSRISCKGAVTLHM